MNRRSCRRAGGSDGAIEAVPAEKQQWERAAEELLALVHDVCCVGDIGFGGARQLGR